MSIADTLVGFASSLRARLNSINVSLAGKGQTSAGNLAEVPAKIDAISTGADVSGVTATEQDVIAPKVFVNSSGEQKTGSILTKVASDITVSGASVTVPAGYYASAASKSVSAATQATPSISVSSGGLITASVTQSAGYVSSGTKSATRQLSTKSAETFNPSTSDQTIPSGRYLTGAQIIKGDSNFIESNIKNGVSLFGKVGTYGGDGNAYIGEPISSQSSSANNLIFYVPNIDKTIGFYVCRSASIYSASDHVIISAFIIHDGNNVGLRLFLVMRTNGYVRGYGDTDDSVLGFIASGDSLSLIINDNTYGFESSGYVCYPIYGS